MNLTLGETIKKIRTEKGIGVYELAADIDVSTATIYHLESDYRIPSIITLCKICKGLECDLNTIVPEWMYKKRG